MTRPPVWEIAVHLAVAGDVFDGVYLCRSFSQDMDEIWDLIGSISVSLGAETRTPKNSPHKCLIQILTF